jgi:hypothetical protein
MLRDKSSSSPSIISFGTILDKAKKLNIEIATKMFIASQNTPQVYGLEYEQKVYKEILDKILAKKESLNFISYIASGMCTLSELKPKYSERDFTKLMIDLNKFYGKVDVESRVSLLATEKVKNGRSLYDVLEDESQQPTEEEWVAIYFQLVHAIYTMGKIKLVHNDLHYGNIFVQILPTSTVLRYTVRGVQFEIATRYIVYLYDWDFAYCESLGRNRYLEEDALCYIANACNEFNPKIDLYRIVCETFYFPQRTSSVFRYFRQFRHENYRTCNTLIQPEYFDIRDEKIFNAMIAQSENYKFIDPFFIVNGKQLSDAFGYEFDDYFDPWFAKETRRLSIIFLHESRTVRIALKNFACKMTEPPPTFPTAEELLFFEGEWTRNRTPLFNHLIVQEAKFWDVLFESNDEVLVAR